MDTSDLLRHQIITSVTAHHTKNVADVAVRLWEQMATQIISIVGEGGFNSLYARSVFLTRTEFPWLAVGALPPQPDERFAGLKNSLEGQTPAQASAASCLLLLSFTDILAALIGEQLTTRILRSAWGDGASDKAGKEFENE